MRRFLPRSYLEKFVDPDERSEVVWVHRPVIGVFQAAPLEPDGTTRHFNEADEPALHKNDDLERLLAEVESEAALLVAGKLAHRGALAPAERDVLASFFALLGIRLSSGFGQLGEDEARRGHDEFVAVNARTLLRAKKFALAPKPAIPG